MKVRSFSEGVGHTNHWPWPYFGTSSVFPPTASTTWRVGVRKVLETSISSFFVGVYLTIFGHATITAVNIILNKVSTMTNGV